MALKKKKNSWQKSLSTDLYTVTGLLGFWVILCNMVCCPGDTSAGVNDDALVTWFSNRAMVKLKGHIPG